MKDSMPKVVHVYWKVLCHCNICMDLHEQWKGRISFAKWVRYLITDAKTPKVLRLSTLLKVAERLNNLKGHERIYTSSYAESNFPEGMTFDSYHY